MLKIIQYSNGYSNVPAGQKLQFGQDLCASLKTIVHLGVQGPLGTKFSINGSDVIIGPSQTFELDNIFDITSLIFKEETNDKIIVDIIYKDGEL